MLAEVVGAIGSAGGLIGAVDLVSVDGETVLRDITVDAGDEDHAARIAAALETLEGVRVIDRTDRTFLLHLGGKIEMHNKHPLKTRDDLSMAYTPGSPGSARRSPRTPTRPSSTRSSATRSPWSPTGPRCSASATSAPRPRCR